MKKRRRINKKSLQAATSDAQHVAKKKGADILKQWDAVLDGRTREDHRNLDGQIRELDEDFEVNGNKAERPGYFGIPAEDINCRCACLTRARWALDQKELEPLKDRANFYGMEKTYNFQEFKKKYMQSVEIKTESDKILIKGALTSKNDPDNTKREEHAKKYYSSIRNSDPISIINAISKNVSFDHENVSKAINHLFFKKHNLDKGFDYFDEDYDIAESIQRLREGKNIQLHDLALIQHEALEADYMGNGMPYEEAHYKTEGKYNYTLALWEYLKSNGLE